MPGNRPLRRRWCATALLFAGLGLLLLPACPEQAVLPDTTAKCAYVSAGTPACCSDGGGCGSGLWCNTYTCACEDIESPCGGGYDGGVVIGPIADAGTAPSGAVGATGGTVDRLWFASTGDTRPGNCDDALNYPRAIIEQISRTTKSMQAQFVLDLGDHMFVCNGVAADAVEQMGYYTDAMALGPATWFLSMGNHECGRFVSGGAGGADGAYGCYGTRSDANFDAYMAALKRPKPWYHVDITTGQGLARIVVVANDSWDAAQKAWLQQTLTEADTSAKYTILARHQPFTGSRPGLDAINTIVQAHKISLLLTAHSHTYYHGSELGGRAAVVGLGGAPGNAAPGFVTVMQQADGRLVVQRRDLTGNPLGAAWAVTPQ